ncbi:hypothetical protein CW304_09275 [Bacillus sp. UFRGS-B20]|nr:hypothetical protein CW304_09275 [Bacillus sp. UFRGS-B20]
MYIVQELGVIDSAIITGHIIFFLVNLGGNMTAQLIAIYTSHALATTTCLNPRSVLLDHASAQSIFSLIPLM